MSETFALFCALCCIVCCIAPLVIGGAVWRVWRWIRGNNG